jgi:hypothetical protein
MGNHTSSVGPAGFDAKKTRIPRAFYIIIPSSSFHFRILQLMLPEALQPYGLLYYPRIGLSNFLHQFRAATAPKQRKLEL